MVQTKVVFIKSLWWKISVCIVVCISHYWAWEKIILDYLSIKWHWIPRYICFFQSVVWYGKKLLFCFQITFTMSFFRLLFQMPDSLLNGFAIYINRYFFFCLFWCLQYLNCYNLALLCLCLMLPRIKRTLYSETTSQIKQVCLNEVNS